MFIVNSPTVATFFCVLTMIGWGSWANTRKLSGSHDWPFSFFYWDYCIGVVTAGALFCASLGSWGTAGQSFLTNLDSASRAFEFRAVFAGLLFNLANVLLVAAIDAAGLAIAFPVGIGLALVIGTAASYARAPKGNPVLLVLGVAFILGAMAVSAVANSRRPGTTAAKKSGILYAVLAGGFMGFFYPELLSAISPAFNTEPIAAGTLTPYTALLLFGIGVLISGVPFTMILLRATGSTSRSYLWGSPATHLPGILGGWIWMIALGLNIIASGVAGPAISYALGQGATLVAAIWGIFVWHEFRGARKGTYALVAFMLFGYSLGLLVIWLATI
jgi:glucose uptake protein